ncbi:PepSY domain-containing protein [Chamaesiphon sp. OTE_20_metabat_361]|uniref:PepSY domain-containing protein n=1 Tax=Chamaesiphon sp. OTE_20_metabat_361 TaxID=2964689 RepID=UPI00286C1957|nr:PepSY domain-containing protein [Chamaesiphon sp. OTE_20_metabat_361]
MTNRKSLQLRQLHRTIAPIMVLPLLLSAITGSIYQITDLSGKEVKWLLEAHKGNFGFIKLEAIYPFLNALGLLALLATGTSMLLQTRRTPRRRTEED